MTWSRSRVLALGGLAAGAMALVAAVLSAVGGPDRAVSAAKAAEATIRSRTVAVGEAHISVRALPGGTCFTVRDAGGSAHACPSRTGAPNLSFVLTPHGVGGIAGNDVRAVIVRLTRKGTVWATLRDGVFYAAPPSGYRVRAVVKVLRDGSRRAFKA
jgi:hypothetical protein